MNDIICNSNNTSTLIDSLTSLSVEFKNDKALLKFMFSSLFARRSQYLVKGTDANKWLFTNVDPITQVLHATNLEHQYNFIVFRNTSAGSEFIAHLYEILPFFKQSLFCIDITLFNKVINGCKTLDNLSFSPNTETGKIVVFDKTDPSLSVECGTLLSEEQTNQYFDIYEMYTSDRAEDGDDAEYISVDDWSRQREGVYFTKVTDNKTGTYVYVPISDGLNCIAKKECLDKYPSCCNTQLIWWRVGRAISSAMVTRFHEFTVTSLQPFAYRFMMSQIDFNKN